MINVHPCLPNSIHAYIQLLPPRLLPTPLHHALFHAHAAPGTITSGRSYCIHRFRQKPVTFRLSLPLHQLHYKSSKMRVTGLSGRRQSEAGKYAGKHLK